MGQQVATKTAIPLLASWGWDDRIQAPTSKVIENHKTLQNLRWEAATTIDREFKDVLQFVAPSCDNFHCHSSRIAMLFIRTCVEIESCFKSILSENHVSKNRQKNISDFSRVELSHSLSRFSARIHGWHQPSFTFLPFQDWTSAVNLADGKAPSPSWYKAYGKVKHNILETHKYGTFENLCHAIAGLHALLVSQFGHDGWGPNRGSIGFYHAPEYECVVGDVVEVRFPPREECRIIYDLPKTWDFQIEPFNYS